MELFLTYLFRLCFIQCNASLHFGSSKHSLLALKKTPPSLTYVLLFSIGFPIICCFWVPAVASGGGRSRFGSNEPCSLCHLARIESPFEHPCRFSLKAFLAFDAYFQPSAWHSHIRCSYPFILHLNCAPVGFSHNISQC